MGRMIVETCALNWTESLYKASEFKAPVRAAKPINRVLSNVENEFNGESRT